jgi:hypothetical protein
MGIRRRRKKLTTVITSVDRRLRSVEFRHVPTRIAPRTITAAEVAPGVIPSDDPKDNGATGSISSETAPSEFAIITAAAYSAGNITGNTDRVDITTSQNHNLSVGDKVTIYGLNNQDVNLDGTYVITEVPTSTTLKFTRGLSGFYSAVVNLNTYATVSSYSSTTTTATLTLSASTHGIVVGDIVTVTDIATNAFFNGTFKVKEVSGADIKYDFASTQTATSTTTETGKVKSVLHKYQIIGDTWIDTSVTPNTVKVWDGLQWVSPSSIPDGVIIDDHMAPKPPTNLAAVTNGYYDPTTGKPNVAVTLSWDAPTQNADNSTLTDLAGYRVLYRYKTQSITGGTTGSTGVEPAGRSSTAGSETNSDGVVSGTFSWNNTFVSTVPTITMSTSVGTLSIPATFSATKGKGTVAWEVSGLENNQAFTISWASSGSNKYGAGTIAGTVGDTVNYTPTNTPPTTGFSISGALKITGQTLPTATGTTGDIQSTTDAAPSAQWVSAGETDQTSMSMRDFSVSSTIDFAVQAIDSSRMNYSEYSDTLTLDTGTPAIILNAPSAPTMEARLGTLTIKWDGYDDQGVQPPPFLSYTEVHLGTVSTFTPSSSTIKGRLERLGYNELVVANLTYGTTYYAKLIFVSSTGAKTLASDPSTGVTVAALVDTDVIGKVLSGAKIVDGSIIAYDKIYGNTITGDLIQSRTIKAGSLEANSITANEIKAGALDAYLITGATIQTAATGGRIVLNSSAMTAYASNGTTQTFNINASTGAVTIGGYIASGGAAADINAGTTTISGGKITTGTIEASAINAGTLTGFTIKTAASGTRVEMGGTNISFYKGSDYAGNITGGTTGAGSSMVFYSTGNGRLEVEDYGVNLFGDGDAELTVGSNGSNIQIFSTTNGIVSKGAWSHGNGSFSVRSFSASSTASFSGGSIPSWQSAGNAYIADGAGRFANSGVVLGLSRSSSGTIASFQRFSTEVGTIDITTTATAYRTSSDYRLKENVVRIPDAVSRLMLLKPSRYNFISEPDTVMEGFLAHEVQEVIPIAASGHKDQVDSDGNPIYQGVDYSLVVPLLTAAIQELATKVVNLENK